MRTILLLLSTWAAVARAEDLYSNSGSFTAPVGDVTPNAGCLAADVSPLQTSLGLITLGFGHSPLSDSMIADDVAFALPPGAVIDEVVFFSFQPNATAPTITQYCFTFLTEDPFNQAPPELACVNAASTMTGVYRAHETSLTSCTREIQQTIVPINPPYVVGAGPLWLVWRAQGTINSGPYCPTIVVLGQASPPNANARISVGGEKFTEARDTGPSFALVAFPFVLRGSLGGGGCAWDLDGDEKVCQSDLGALLAEYGGTYNQSSLGGLLAEYNGGCGDPCP